MWKLKADGLWVSLGDRTGYTRASPHPCSVFGAGPQCNGLLISSGQPRENSQLHPPNQSSLDRTRPSPTPAAAAALPHSPPRSFARRRWAWLARRVSAPRDCTGARHPTSASNADLSRQPTRDRSARMITPAGPATLPQSMPQGGTAGRTSCPIQVGPEVWDSRGNALPPPPPPPPQP